MFHEKTVAKAAAQPGIAADRFAREIVGFLKASSSALAAAECQTVGPPPIIANHSPMLFGDILWANVVPGKLAYEHTDPHRTSWLP